MGIDTVLWSRLVTGMTLGFHMIFATIGVGIPLMIAIAEFIGIRKQDSHYILMAKRWARGFVISVAVGVVTGSGRDFEDGEQRMTRSGHARLPLHHFFKRLLT